MKITNPIWRFATVAVILACVCLASVIYVFAIDTPWIDMSQITTQEETEEETPTPDEENTTTPPQDTTENNGSEDVSGEVQTNPLDTEVETTEEQTEAKKSLFGGCKSAFSVQTEGCVLLLGGIAAVALAMKKRASHNA